MRVVHEIVDAQILHLSVHERRERIVAHLRGRNVAFKDVAAFLEKEAIREGYANSPSDIVRAREKNLAWVVYMDRYIMWINKTYKPGWIKKEPLKKVTKNPSAPAGQVVAIPAALSEKRAEKLLENPENKKIIENKLIEEGVIVIDNSKISKSLVERLLEDPENERTLIEALNQLGYKVRKPKVSAA